MYTIFKWYMMINNFKDKVKCQIGKIWEDSFCRLGHIQYDYFHILWFIIQKNKEIQKDNYNIIDFNERSGFSGYYVTRWQLGSLRNAYTKRIRTWNKVKTICLKKLDKKEFQEKNISMVRLKENAHMDRWWKCKGGYVVKLGSIE